MDEQIQSEKKSFARHYEDSALINAGSEDIFAYVDDHTRFSSHMNRSSWMMGGGSMKTEMDQGMGQNVGSHIRMRGNVFGISLFFDEVVTHHEPPRRKVWETVGTPKLLVVGNYRMGLEINDENGISRLRVFIDYMLPAAASTRWLGYLFGGIYAKWCVRQMIHGTMEQFKKSES